MDDADWEDWERRYEEETRPLWTEKRFGELCEHIAAMLEDETDPDNRFTLMSDLATYLGFAGDADAELRWLHVLTTEFADEPMAWTRLAGFYSPVPGQPDAEAMATALGHYRTALEKARQRGEFVRYVLADMCRLLVKQGAYEALAEHMRMLLDDHREPRQWDTPQFEADWVKRIPEGAVDPELIAAFERYEALDARRRAQPGDEPHAPTLDELDRLDEA